MNGVTRMGGVLVLAWTVMAQAQTAVQDGFESGAFAAEWDTVGAGVAVTSGVGADGSARCAALGALNNLGARFTDAAPNGAADFSVECDFLVTNVTGRQFNLHLSTATGLPGSGAPAVNLRLEGGAFAAYSGSWRALAGLGTVATGQWHRMRLSGWGWGRPGARYGVQLSEAGGTAFTRASPTNLAWYQSGVPTNAPARYFDFTTDFGAAPGFLVDNVRAEITAPFAPDAVLCISGVYPHLAVFSADDEIGIGAVMPWAGRLWFVTYPPHQPAGSPDKLWTVTTNLALSAYAGSVGCTDANRLVHRESGQLNIGHYLVDATGGVRVLPPALLRGRLTGSARHLTDPTNKFYVATMEEGLYEVDVNSLAVTELYHDMNTAPTGAQRAASLPGNHGKGLYRSQGRLFYSNNGSGGSLSAWDGASWAVVETNKFTEVTGPGGVAGNESGDDRLWSLGWDARSVILRLYQGGAWQRFRLPKGSYTHDSDTGWYTEWPRIREVKEGLALMHMHGLFYRFPKGFGTGAAGGLEPLCTFLKMPVDYCWWEGRLVLGRDDASTTGGNIWAGQSHSAPWFGDVDDLRRWGPPAGVGGPWVKDAVRAGVASDPFFVGGFSRRALHLRHAAASAVQFALEVDADGSGAWRATTNLAVPAGGYAWCALPASAPATWARLTPSADAAGVTATFVLGSPARAAAPELLAGLAPAGAPGAYCDGILRPQSGDARTLQFAASRYAADGSPLGQAYYEIGGAFALQAVSNAAAEAALRGTYGLTNAGFTVDAASVVVTDGASRFRLPKGHPAYDAAGPGGWPRGRREVVTERQLFNAHGTFYELPYSGSGGLRRLRPVCTHNRLISDFCSWRGLLVLAGVCADAATNGHVFASSDGRAALWFGDVDDLWRFGPPRGEGGPWLRTPVAAGAASDPYLMAGYERKELRLSHGGAGTVTFTVEVDAAADDTWSAYGAFAVPPGATVTHLFPEAYAAHWVRFKADAACEATALLTYRPRRTSNLVLR